MPYLPMPVDEPDPKHQFLDLDSFERPQPVPGPVSKVVKSVPKFDCNFDIDRLEQLCYEDLDFSDGVPERKSMKEKTATTPNREYAEEPRDYRNFIQVISLSDLSNQKNSSRECDEYNILFNFRFKILQPTHQLEKSLKVIMNLPG